MVEFRETLADGTAGPLKMVAILDVLDDGLSAVYTFYEPDEQSSYGTYGVLWQIEQAKHPSAALRVPGLLDSRQPKMSYKANFKPHQLLLNSVWLDGAQRGSS